MDEKELQFTDYLKVIRNRKWILITVFVAVVGMVSLYTIRQTPIYQATATILIDPEPDQVIKVQEVNKLGSNWDYEQYYNTQLKILQSLAIAEKTLEKFGGPQYFFTTPKEEPLLVPAKSPVVDSGLIDSRPLDLPAVETRTPAVDYSKQAGRLAASLTVTPMKDSRLVKLSARSPDPAKAARITNAVAQVFVEENLARKLRATSSAQAWLLQQAQEAEGKLQAAENTLESYRRATGMVSLEQSQNIVVTRLQEISTAYTRAQSDRIQALAAYNQLKSLPRNDLNALESMPAVVDNTLIRDLKLNYINLESQYQKLLDKYTPKHPEMVRLSAQINSLKNRIFSEIDKIAQKYRMDYETALEREKELKNQLAQQEKGALGLGEKAVNYNILKRAADTNREIYQMLLTRAKETGLSEQIKVNNITILDKATIPTSPIGPNTSRNIMLGIVLGLGLGTGLAFFAEYLDKSVKTDTEIREDLKMPLLGSVPIIKIKQEYARDKIILEKDGKYWSEPFRVLRTNILLTSPDKPLKNILITSAGPQEGKTLVVSNLSIIFSQTGSKVLLIDADLRKPQLHNVFNLPREKGLSTYLVGEAGLEEVIQLTGIENLSVITCGKIPPNPAELLASQKMQEFSRLIRERFDYVFYDSPPLFPVTDAVILSASVADSVVLVVRANRTPKEIVKRSQDALNAARATLAGVVLNSLREDSNSYYYQYYYAGYHHKDNA